MWIILFTFVPVVICFHFTIFVVLETTHSAQAPHRRWLWFAFILLSLSYWKQLLKINNPPSIRCDLLSFYYLCRTGNNVSRSWVKPTDVVICFHFTIFVVLETTVESDTLVINTLWFAFILLSLSYWKQPTSPPTVAGSVVICFHFTIFVVLETTVHEVQGRAGQLWFAFILLSLSYWKQHKGGKIDVSRRCDLLSFYYLCRTGNNRIYIICCISARYRDNWNTKNVVSDRM